MEFQNLIAACLGANLGLSILILFFIQYAEFRRRRIDPPETKSPFRIPRMDTPPKKNLRAIIPQDPEMIGRD